MKIKRYWWIGILIGIAINLSFADDAGQTLQLTPVDGTAYNSVAPYQPQVVAKQSDPNQFFSNPPPQQEQAFQGMVNQAMPLTPEQIIRFRKMLDETKRAAVVPAATPPKPVLSTGLVSLAPGATPPVIRLQQGFVTSVVFVDSTGASWPIESYDLGNPQAFNIQWQSGTNTLMIQAMKMYEFGNLAVKLQGLTTPVMVTLVPGDQEVDYRADLRIQQPGPLAKISMTSSDLSQPANSELLGVLDSVPPEGAQTLQVSGGEVQAWLYNDKLFLRTRLILLSPSWKAIMSSPDGTNAYELDKTSTILVSQDGAPRQLKIEGL